MRDNLVALSFQLEALRFHVAEYLDAHVEQWRGQIKGLVDQAVTEEALARRLHETVIREVNAAIARLVRTATTAEVESAYGQAVRRAVEQQVRTHYERIVSPVEGPRHEEWPTRCGNCEHFAAGEGNEGSCNAIESRHGGPLRTVTWAICGRWSSHHTNHNHPNHNHPASGERGVSDA